MSLSGRVFRTWRIALAAFAAIACSSNSVPGVASRATSTTGDRGGDGAPSDDDAGDKWCDVNAAAPATDADAGPEITPELCDGSDRVRLRYAITGGGQSPLGDEPMLGNGWSYWVITGRCHYYVMVDPWKEVREGDLSHARAQRIARGVHYGRLGELAAAYVPSPVQVSDGGSVSLWDAMHAIGCYGSCDSAPAPVREAMDFAYSQLATLHEDGAPVHGPIRMSLIRFDFPGPSPMTLGTVLKAVDWPLTSVQPDDVAIHRDDPRWALDPAYTGMLIEDRYDVQALRDLRDAMWAGKFGPSKQFDRLFWIWGDTKLTRYELRFRDTIPLEDEDGVIQMEFAPEGEPDADAGP